MSGAGLLSLCRVGVLLGIALVLTACGEEENKDVKEWMREASKGLKADVPPLPEVRPPVTASYEASNLLDPFSPGKIESSRKLARAGGLQPDMNRRREPLESFPLDTLVMVGTIGKGNVTVALVLAGKTLHRVRVGNYMGQNFGVVTAISDTQITLKELVEDSGGDWVVRIAVIQLQEVGK